MTETGYQLVPLGQLHESKLNPRKHFDAKALEELAASIKAKGVLTPLLVRPNAKGFEIAAGHRRLRAAKAAGLELVPTVVRPMTDTEFLEVLTIENLQREDVHPLEEADGYRALMQTAGYDVDAIAAKVGKSASYVYQRLKLADLVEPARKAFLAEELTAGHAILIARLQPKDQAAALKACAAERWIPAPNTAGADERRVKDIISVRELAAWIQANVHLDLHSTRFRKDDATLVAAAGPCTTCPKRTGSSPDLFPEVSKKDTCTDPACFKAKVDAHTAQQLAELGVKGKPTKVTHEHWSRGVDGEIFTNGKWKAAKPESCKFVRPAIIPYGKDHGEALTVCTNEKCRTHFKGRAAGGSSSRSSGSGSSPDMKKYREEERRRREKQETQARLRRRIFDAVRDKVKGPLAPEDLRLVARRLYETVESDAVDEIYAWKKKGWSFDAATTRVAQLKAADVPRFIIECCLASEIDYTDGRNDALLAMAKRYKIDAAKIERDLKAEKAAATTKATTSHAKVPKKR